MERQTRMAEYLATAKQQLESDNFTMNGYQYHNISRKETHRYAKRNSGGVGLYIRNNIAKGVEVSKIVNNDFMMWIMLRKDFFNLCHDVYIVYLYSPRRFYVPARR